VQAAAPGASPLDVSYWLAANLPLPEEERQQLLELRNTADRLRHILRLVKARHPGC
jgi:Lon protease-like protein